MGVLHHGPSGIRCHTAGSHQRDHGRTGRVRRTTNCGSSPTPGSGNMLSRSTGATPMQTNPAPMAPAAAVVHQWRRLRHRCWVERGVILISLEKIPVKAWTAVAPSAFSAQQTVVAVRGKSWVTCCQDPRVLLRCRQTRRQWRRLPRQCINGAD